MFLLERLGLVHSDPIMSHREQMNEQVLSNMMDDQDDSACEEIERKFDTTWPHYPPLIHEKIGPLHEGLQNNPVKQITIHGATTPNPVFPDQLSISLHSLTNEHKLQLLDGITPPKFVSCYGCWDLGSVLGLNVIGKEDEPREMHKVLDFLASKHCKTDFSLDPRSSEGIPQEMFMGIYKMMTAGTSSQSVFLIMGSPQGCATAETKRHSRRGRHPADRELNDNLVVDVCLAKHMLERRMEVVALEIVTDMIETFLPPSQRVVASAAIAQRLTVHEMDSYTSGGMHGVRVMGLNPTYFADIDQITAMTFSTGVADANFSTEKFPIMCQNPILGMNLVSAADSTEIYGFPSCVIDYSSKKPPKSEIKIHRWRLGNMPTEHHRHPFLDLGRPFHDEEMGDKEFWLCSNPTFEPSLSLPLVKHGHFIPIVFCAPVPESKRA